MYIYIYTIILFYMFIRFSLVFQQCLISTNLPYHITKPNLFIAIKHWFYVHHFSASISD